MMELDSSMYDDDLTVETVQLIKVQFRIEKAVEFGEVLRMVGGTRAWELVAARVPALKWSEGTSGSPRSWSSRWTACTCTSTWLPTPPTRASPWRGKRATTTSADFARLNAPALVAQDDWSGDPSKAYTMRPDGEGKMQAETRLVQRLGDADAALHESVSMEVMDLKVEVKNGAAAVRRR